MENKSYESPSYNKSLSIEKRLYDFLGKYYINLNGVVPNNLIEITEPHKKDIVDFIINHIINEQSITPTPTEMIEGKELFDMVYQWGRAGIVCDHTCPAFKSALQDYINKVIKEKGYIKREDAINEVLEVIMPQARDIDTNEPLTPEYYSRVGYNKCIADIAVKHLKLKQKGEGNNGK